MPRSMRTSVVVAVAALLSPFALQACGQKGPLFLAEPSNAASAPRASLPLPPPPVRP